MFLGSLKSQMELNVIRALISRRAFSYVELMLACLSLRIVKEIACKQWNIETEVERFFFLCQKIS